jgi:hypothetical protein
MYGRDTSFLTFCTAEHWQLVPFIASNISLHGFLRSIIRDADGNIVAPVGYTPSSPHRMSADDAVNAWLWIIKGDGDVTERKWKAMKVVELLVDKDAVVAMIAGMYKSGSKICRLLKETVYLDEFFQHAVAASNMTVVKYMVEDKLVSLSGSLCYVQDVPTAMYLVEKKADLSCWHHREALHNAKNVDIARYLLRIGAKVHAGGDLHNTPLHKVQNIAIARCLLEHKADVNRKNGNNCTPLHTTKDKDILQLLIEHNADVNTVITGSGNTRLHNTKDPNIVHLLIKNGADAYVVNKSGDTPLHLAKDDATVEALVANTARYRYPAADSPEPSGRR